MQTTPETPFLASEAVKLASYLRQNPSAIDESPSDLAQLAGVSPSLIERAMTQVDLRASQGNRQREAKRFKVPAWMRWCGDLWMSITENAGAFFLVTILLSIVLFLIGDSTSVDSNATQRTGISIQDDDVLKLIAVLGTTFLHYFCMMRHGKFRTVFLGTAISYAAMLISAGIMILRNGSNRGQTPIEQFAISGFAFFVLAIVYGFFGAVFSFVGAGIRMRRIELSKDYLSRQDLLERLFELEERLNAASENKVDLHGWHSLPLFKQIESNPWSWAGVVSFCMSTIVVLLVGILEQRFGIDHASFQSALSAGLIGLLSITFQTGLAFLGGKVWRSVLISMLYTVCGNIPMLIGLYLLNVPVPGTGDIASHVAGLIFAIVIGVIAGIAGAIERRGLRDRMMQLNDPETLLYEYLDIQRRLNPGPRDITVVVVDAEKSSVMKMMADPYVAEWSFRAYQQMLERVTQEHNGEVLSTAGDGAIMVFNNPIDALAASEDIQEKIREFNNTVNKLSMPFKLRIGIHRGTIVGHIEKVQFTEVIDIAAHVEAASEVGGIALTERVWETMPGLRGEPLNLLVDNQVVYKLEMRTV